MIGQHAHMLAKKDGRSVRSAKIRKQKHFFLGRSCLQKTAQGRNASMQILGKGASSKNQLLDGR